MRSVTIIIITMPPKRKGKRRRHDGLQQQNVPLKRAMLKLVRMNGKKRQSALRQANNVFIRQFVSAVKGVRRKPVSSKVRAKLTRHRLALRALANPQSSLQSKRKVLVRQKGGFFGALLSALASPILGSLVSKVLGG